MIDIYIDPKIIKYHNIIEVYCDDKLIDKNKFAYKVPVNGKISIIGYNGYKKIIWYFKLIIDIITGYNTKESLERSYLFYCKVYEFSISDLDIKIFYKKIGQIEFNKDVDFKEYEVWDEKRGKNFSKKIRKILMIFLIVLLALVIFIFIIFVILRKNNI